MSKSQWQRIYRHLSDAGFEVYSPGQHQGDCTSPYVVIKDEGAMRLTGLSSTQQLYDALCYVPSKQFSALEPFVASVKAALKQMYPELIPTYQETESFLDDSIDGVMISVQYRSSHKI